MEKSKSIVDLFVEKYESRRGIRRAQVEEKKEKDMPLEPEKPIEDEVEKLTEEEATKELEKSNVDEKEKNASDIEDEIVCFIGDLSDYYDIEVEDLVDALKEVLEDEDARKELIEKVKSHPKGERREEGEGFEGEGFEGREEETSIEEEM